MKKYLTAYGMFLAFALVTAVVVRPMLAKTGIPLLTKI